MSGFRLILRRKREEKALILRVLWLLALLVVACGPVAYAAGTCEAETREDVAKGRKPDQSGCEGVNFSKGRPGSEVPDAVVQAAIQKVLETKQSVLFESTMGGLLVAGGGQKAVSRVSASALPAGVNTVPGFVRSHVGEVEVPLGISARMGGGVSVSASQGVSLTTKDLYRPVGERLDGVRITLLCAGELAMLNKQVGLEGVDIAWSFLPERGLRPEQLMALANAGAERVRMESLKALFMLGITDFLAGHATMTLVDNPAYSTGQQCGAKL